jgi:hypothetical protein
MIADSINDMASLKKLNQQRVPQNPFGPILGALPKVVATDVAVRAQVALDLVHFGIQDCYDNIAYHLFASGLRPNIRDEVMRQSPTALNEAKAFASDAEKQATIPHSKTLGATSLPVMPVEDNDNADTAKTEAKLLRKPKNLRIVKLLSSKQKSTVSVAIMSPQDHPTPARPHLSVFKFLSLCFPVFH